VPFRNQYFIYFILKTNYTLSIDFFFPHVLTFLFDFFCALINGRKGFKHSSHILIKLFVQTNSASRLNNVQLIQHRLSFVLYLLTHFNTARVFHYSGLLSFWKLDRTHRPSRNQLITFYFCRFPGLNLTQDFRITVRDTNDRPTDILTSIPLVVSENSNLGSSVAVFTAVDEDAGQTHRFLITDVTAVGYGSNR
jgi:hypothetical protein